MTFAPLQGSVPPMDLDVQDVPSFPESIDLAIAPYWDVTGNLCLGWQPGTNAMLVSSTSEDTHKMRLLYAPLQEPKLSSLLDEKFVLGSFMPKIGDLIVYSADHNGDELNQLYGFNLGSNKSQLLTDGNSRNNNVIFDHTGQRIAFLSSMAQARHDVIYVMDPRDPDSRRIIMAPDSDGWMLEDWTHDGSHILVSHLTSQGGYLWSIDANSGDTRLLTKTQETQQLYVVARYMPQDTGIYGVVYTVDGKRTINFLPLDNSAAGKVPTGVTQADEMELSPDGTWLAYVTGEAAAETLHLFNTTTGEELPRMPLDPALFIRLRWNEDSTELGFSYGSSTAPFQAYSYKIPTGKLSQWTQTEGPNQPVAIKPELIKIRSFDGLEISGYLYRPDPRKFSGKRPVIVSIHGGPSAEFIPDYLGPYNYYLDSMGVALFYPNVRGSSGFGPDFTELDNGLKREDSVRDIGAFLDWIATDSRLDGNRIGVQGASYGGYMTLATLFHFGNQVRCGSDMMGITDFVTFLRHTSVYRQSNRRYEYGDERYPDMNKFLEGISPLNHVAEIHDPVMITAGQNDPRVPVSESDQMVKALQAQHGIVWYILGENEGHGFRRTRDAQYQFAAEAFFFQTYLLPETRLTPLGPAAPEIKSTHPVLYTAPD